MLKKTDDGSNGNLKNWSFTCQYMKNYIYKHLVGLAIKVLASVKDVPIGLKKKRGMYSQSIASLYETIGAFLFKKI